MMIDASSDTAHANVCSCNNDSDSGFQVKAAVAAPTRIYSASRHGRGGLYSRKVTHTCISSVILVVSLARTSSAFMIHPRSRSNVNVPSYTHHMCRTPHQNQLCTLFSKSGDEDDVKSGGAELAAEFNEFIKLKELQDKLIAGEGKNKKNKPNPTQRPQQPTSSSAQTRTQPPFANRKEVRVDKNGKPYDVTPNRNRNSNSNSAGLFTNNPPVSLFSTPSSSSEQQRPRSFTGNNNNNNNGMPASLLPQQNVNAGDLGLVRRAELSLAVQMIVALVCLTGLVVVGLNGGITDGSERFGSGSGSAAMEMMDSNFMDMPDFSIITDGSDLVPETIGSSAGSVLPAQAGVGAEDIWI
jgi:hypothetical protein